MPKYFEFEVSLRRVEPKIWRRFQLAVEDSTFQDLHEAIQDACAWENCHMFLFRRDLDYDDPIAGVPSEEDLDMYGMSVHPAELAFLSPFFGEGRTKHCIYEYDFGDGWRHDVVLLRVVELSETFCCRFVGGERAFPHEDCGGISGYERCVEFVRTGKDSLEDDPEGFREWLGDWHPDHFDFEAMRKKFDRVFRRTRAKGKRKARKPSL